MQGNLISLNIINDNYDVVRLLNKNSEPIVFYSATKHYLDFLKNSIEFYEYLCESNIFTVDNYTNSKLYICYINDDESYTKDVIEIQKMFPLDNNMELIDHYLYNIIYKTYTQVKKSDVQEKFDNILDIHNKIKELCPKTEENTIINYYMSLLRKDYNNIDNKNFNFLRTTLINKL